MAFNVTPSPTPPSSSVTCTGTGAKKRPTRIRVSETDPVMGNAILAEFTMAPSGKFKRQITAPGGPPRSVTLLLQQKRSDGVWAQTASVKVLLVAGGGGGGTTPPSPPADTSAPIASTPTITAITQTSVQVSWTTNEPATGQIEYGTTVSYGSTTTLDSTLTTSKSQTVSGLTAGTLYHYRIKASDAVPNAGNSIDRTFTTTAAAPAVPAAPTGLVATPGNTTVTLNWTAIAGATYKVYKGGVFLANSSSNSYVATGLTNGVLVSFTVSAVNGGGEGAQSGAVTATPTSPPTDTTPPVLSNPVTTNITQTGALVSWTANEPATGQVEYGTTTSYGSATATDGTLSTSKSRTLSGLTASTLYHYRAKSLDAAGNIGYSIDRTFTTATPPAPTVPAAPTGLTAGSTNQAVQLNWNAIAGCTYKVYRNASGGAYSLIASPSANSYYNTGLTNGILYGYKVSAVNGAGEGAQSAAVTATPTAPSGNVVSFAPNQGASAFVTLLQNNAIDVIEMAAGTYSNWHINWKNFARSNPVLVRPVPGAQVIFDGAGTSGGLFKFGTLVGAGTPSVPTQDVHFNATGTGGRFIVQNYNLGSDGLILLGWYERLSFIGWTFRNCQGTGNQSHCIYSTSDSAHTSEDLICNDITAGPFSGRSLSAFQTWDPDTSRPNVAGITLHDWTVSGCNRAAYLAGGATGVDIDNWDIANCNATFDDDSGSQAASGTISNCSSTGSGPLAIGQGYWLETSMADGGGNTDDV